MVQAEPVGQSLLLVHLGAQVSLILSAFESTQLALAPQSAETVQDFPIHTLLEHELAPQQP